MRRIAPRDEHADASEIVRFGTIASVDLTAGRCTVACGDITTPAIRWFQGRAGSTRIWSPPTVGEQVLLVCPEGELAAGVAFLGVSCNAFPPAGNDGTEVFSFGDGTALSYDPDTHVLTFSLCGGGTFHVDAQGGVTIDAAAGLRLLGSLSVSENLDVGNGATGSFTTPSGQTVMVQAGIITNII